MPLELHAAAAPRAVKVFEALEAAALLAEALVCATVHDDSLFDVEATHLHSQMMCQLGNVSPLTLW